MEVEKLNYPTERDYKSTWKQSLVARIILGRFLSNTWISFSFLISKKKLNTQFLIDLSYRTIFLYFFMMGIIGCTKLYQINRSSLDKKVDQENAVDSEEESFPYKNTIRRSQFVFYSYKKMTGEVPLFDELEVMQVEIARNLQLPLSTHLVHVYLFPTEEKYRTFMHSKYPNLPSRRAFFVETPGSRGAAGTLMVYAPWTDYIRQDLRHELTHGIIHASFHNVPLWLDEGLAEYFELPVEQHGVNRNHLETILHPKKTQEKFEPNLARLEQISEKNTRLLQNRNEYRESWAWVHFLLHHSPETKQLLVSYLHDIQTNPHPIPLSLSLRNMFEDPSLELINHLHSLPILQTSKVRTHP